MFDGGNSTHPDLDHLVQLIGYGSETTGTFADYFLVRNSWTPLWGESGFIKLKRYGGRYVDVPCGMDIAPLDGDGCTGGAPQVKVCGQNGVLFDGVYPLM